MNLSVNLAPLLPYAYTASLAGLALICLGLSYWRRGSRLTARFLLLSAIILIIMNPITRQEIRQPVKNKAIIVVDESGSQKISDRTQTTENALQELTGQIAKIPGMDTPIVIRSKGSVDGKNGESTNLFTALRDEMAGLPIGQVAGTVFISDGQIHDVPKDLGPLEKLGPFHALLTGSKNEFDRKISVVSAPKYGLLSSNVQITVRIDEYGRHTTQGIHIQAHQDGQETDGSDALPGEEKTFEFKLDHPGQNVFEFSIPAENGELSAGNNTAPVIINGIRDRLRVLLVSGSPHMGERAWRDLLKSDASIDLVHFTILRSMNSMDSTPPRELSLIEFPVEELFQRKINDFDLIIFDRYQELSLMRPIYFTNMASFVKNGGGLLLALNSTEPDDSIFKTSLNDVLPAEPPASGLDVMQKKFTPTLNDKGLHHPVTVDLAPAPDDQPWGSWFSQSNIVQTKGDALMTGIGQNPLLILNKVGQGRVAVLASDNIWLWAKDTDHGGPYTPLLRNLAHWLMKEPELEDDYIKAEAKGHTITVSEYAGTEDSSPSVTMRTPEGSEKSIDLTQQEKGRRSAKIDVEENGIYSFSNATKKAFVVVGTAQNEEYNDIHTTDEKIRPALSKTGGTAIWLKETPHLSVRTVSPSSKNNGGTGWIGLKENSAYVTKDVKIRPVVSNLMAIFTLMAALLLTWRREGRIA